MNKSRKVGNLIIDMCENDGVKDKCGMILKNDEFFRNNNFITLESRMFRKVLNELSYNSTIDSSDLRAIKEHVNTQNNEVSAKEFRKYIYNTWTKRFYKRISCNYSDSTKITYTFIIFKTTFGMNVKTPLVRIFHNSKNWDYDVHLGENRFACQLKEPKSIDQFINLYNKYSVEVLNVKCIDVHGVGLEINIVERKSWIKTFYLMSTDNSGNKGYFYVNNVEKYCDIEEIGLKTLNDKKLFKDKKETIIRKGDDLYKQVIRELKCLGSSIYNSIVKKIDQPSFEKTHTFTREEFKQVIFDHIAKEVDWHRVYSYRMLKDKRFKSAKWFGIYKLNNDEYTLVKTPIFKTYLDKNGKHLNKVVKIKNCKTLKGKEIDEDSEEIDMVYNGKFYKKGRFIAFRK